MVVYDTSNTSFSFYFCLTHIKAEIRRNADDLKNKRSFSIEILVSVAGLVILIRSSLSRYKMRHHCAKYIQALSLECFSVFEYVMTIWGKRLLLFALFIMDRINVGGIKFNCVKPNIDKFSVQPPNTNQVAYCGKKWKPLYY